MGKKKKNNSKIKKEEKSINKKHKDKNQRRVQNKKQKKQIKEQIKEQINTKNNSDSFNNNNNICIICYSKGEKLVNLKCNHILCSDCYHKWCKIKETCPMCRRKMFNTPAEDPDFENLLRSLYDNRSFLFQKSY